MKKFVALALLFGCLCAVGCSSDKKATNVTQDASKSVTKIENKP